MTWQMIVGLIGAVMLIYGLALALLIGGEDDLDD